MEVKVRTKLNAYRFMLIDKLKKELEELKWFEENDHEFFKLYLGMVKDTEKELKEVEDILSENNYTLVSNVSSSIHCGRLPDFTTGSPYIKREGAIG